MGNKIAFTWPVRVYHEDTDGHGIVYYANYLKFFERARTEMLRSLGFEQDELKQQLALVFVVKSMRMDFFQPAHFNEELIVTANISALKRASLIFEQTIVQPNNPQHTYCSATVHIACLDARTLRPKGLPTEFTKTLNNHVD